MVQYINYKGKQLPIRISYSVMKKLQAKHKKDIAQITMEDLSIYEDILLWSLESGFKAEDKEFTMHEKLEDIMEECFMEFVEVMPVFFQGREEQKTTPQMQVTPGKKKKK